MRASNKAVDAIFDYLDYLEIIFIKSRFYFRFINCCFHRMSFRLLFLSDIHMRRFQLEHNRRRLTRLTR